MEKNMTLAIEPVSMDLVFDDNGALKMLCDDESTAQGIRLTLQTHKSTFPFDETHGTAYDRIFGRDDLEPDEAEEIIREAIFQEPSVEFVDRMVIGRPERDISVQIDGRLYGGRSIVVEVT